MVRTKLYAILIMLFATLSATAQSIYGTWKMNDDEPGTLELEFNTNSAGCIEVTMFSSFDIDAKEGVTMMTRNLAVIPFEWERNGQTLSLTISSTPEVAVLPFGTSGDYDSKREYYNEISDEIMKDEKARLISTIKNMLGPDTIMQIEIVELDGDKMTLSDHDKKTSFTRFGAVPYVPEDPDWRVSVGELLAPQMSDHDVVATPPPSRMHIDETNPDDEEEGPIYTVVEHPAEFPGGDAALLKYIASHMKYPQIAQELEAQGVVMLCCVIREDGSIGKVKVTRSVETHCDAEAIRVVKSLPRFAPAKQQGKVVKTWYTIPVRFQLQ